MQQQKDSRPQLGGLVQSHIAMDVFSEECFLSLCPTTGLVVVTKASYTFSSQQGRGGSMRRSSPTPCIPLPMWRLIFPLLQGAEYLCWTHQFLLSAPYNLTQETSVVMVIFAEPIILFMYPIIGPSCCFICHLNIFDLLCWINHNEATGFFLVTLRLKYNLCYIIRST